MVDFNQIVNDHASAQLPVTSLPTVEGGADKPVRLSKPTLCPGSYDLHLYCDHENPAHGFREFPWHISEFQTSRDARAAARRKGWKLHRDGSATCPKCSKALGGQK